MPQPPPRKVKATSALKVLHSEQVTKLQAKHQQECDLLEDIRTFSRQRSILEKEYAQGLLKLTGQLLKRDFQAMPDLTSDDGQEHRTAMSVWRVILEETDKLAKKRLNAAEAYMERIADPVKPLKANKLQCMKKVLPQFTQIQQEVNQTVLEMTKAQKTYVLDETQANDARMKAKEAEEKLKKKSTGIFQSLASLQKTNAKLQSRQESCEVKVTASRNEYLLCMAAANAHHNRYYNTDLPDLMEVLDGEIFEKIQEYFTIYGSTSQDISMAEMRSSEKMLHQSVMINRQFDQRCFLYTNHVITDCMQYEFEPWLQDHCNRISRDHNAGHVLDKEARKWATKIAKENKSCREFNKSMRSLGGMSTGDRTSESGSSEGQLQDPEIKAEELRQNIRKSETARLKAEARIEALRSAGVNVEEWLSSAQVDSLGLDDDSDLPRTPSRTSLKTNSSGHTDDQEPTYTHYDDDDDFMDDTFDVTVQDIGQGMSASGQPYPIKCHSIYDFVATNADELDMAENEELEIVADGDGDGWVRARNASGKVGFIPQNYIVVDGATGAEDGNDSVIETPTGDQPLNDLPSSPPPPTVVEEPVAELMSPQSPLSSNDVTQEVTSYSSGDIEVQQTTSSMSSGKLNLPLGDDQWVRAIYDYEGTTAEELSFMEGTLIKILRKDVNGIDDGFWEGEINGKVGVFPSLVVEEMTSAEDSLGSFPSPLKSPPDFIPPPPVTVTAATPEFEHPPPPVANGTEISEQESAQVDDENCEPVQADQFKKKVRFRPSYTKYRDVYNHKKNIIDPYDVQFDDDEEESIV